MKNEDYIQQAITLAYRGAPAAYPNPLVGCVIVYNNEIVAQGYHKKFGSHHAEVNAIKALPERYKPADCTVYVTLEPCAHHGKTPPCADLIIAKGFKKVVVGALDPNPLVAGKGIEKMRAAGIDVITGVLESEVKHQNARFFTWHQQKSPYFILKWAQTADGFISRWPVPAEREQNWISGMESNRFVHELRASVMGILVGKNTVLADNPSLTVRHVKGKNPVRLVLDKNLETPRNLNVYNQEAPTIVLNAIHEEIENDYLRFVKLDFESGLLPSLNARLYELGIQSVLVEGGAILLESMLKKEHWNEAFVIENPALFFKNGIKAPQMALKMPQKQLGNDKIYHVLAANYTHLI